MTCAQCGVALTASAGWVLRYSAGQEGASEKLCTACAHPRGWRAEEVQREKAVRGANSRWRQWTGHDPAPPHPGIKKAIRMGGTDR